VPTNFNDDDQLEEDVNGNRAVRSLIARLCLSGSLARLPYRSGLGGLTEQLVQLPGPDSRDQCVDHGRQLVPGRDDDAGLALLELDGPGTELDGIIRPGVEGSFSDAYLQ
jgi:hypothetical protein